MLAALCSCASLCGSGECTNKVTYRPKCHFLPVWMLLPDTLYHWCPTGPRGATPELYLDGFERATEQHVVRGDQSANRIVMCSDRVHFLQVLNIPDLQRRRRVPMRSRGRSLVLKSSFFASGGRQSHTGKNTGRTGHLYEPPSWPGQD